MLYWPANGYPEVSVPLYPLGISRCRDVPSVPTQAAGAIDMRWSLTEELACAFIDAPHHAVPPMLHAAALEPSLFHSVKLRRMLVSWSNIVHHRVNTSQIMASLIHGSLQHYDLPNLEATLGKKLTIEEPLNVVGVAVKEGK